MCCLAAMVVAGPVRPVRADAHHAKVVLLYAKDARQRAPLFPGRAVPEYPLEGFRNPGQSADTVVVGGHSLPPTYFGQPAEAVARAVASFHPSVVVLETCYGASTPILNALAGTGLRAWVVAAPYQLPIRDMIYRSPLFTASDPQVRVKAVDTWPVYPLLRWRLEPAPLARIQRQVDGMAVTELRRRLKQTRPPLVRMPLPSVLEPQGMVLVPVASDRFR